MRINSAGLARLLWGLVVCTMACATPRPESTKSERVAGVYNELREKIDSLADKVSEIDGRLNDYGRRLDIVAKEVNDALVALASNHEKIGRLKGEVGRDKEMLGVLKRYGLGAGELEGDRRREIKDLELSIAEREGQIEGMTEIMNEAHAGLKRIQARISENKSP